MLPDKSHPLWIEIVQNPEAFKEKVNSLSTKVFLSGLKLKETDNSIEFAIDAAYTFFKKNEHVLIHDIESLFN